MMRPYAFFSTAVIAAGVALSAPQARAEYPEKPIRIVVALAAGGPTDAVARLIGDQMSQALGQPIIVDNKPGASGQIGYEFAVRSDADGYTLMLTTNTVTTLPYINTAVQKDLAEKFAPISIIGIGDLVIAVNSEVPVKTFPEFIEYAKKNPGKLNFGAQGGTDLITNQFLNYKAGIETELVRYGGAAPAIQALLANQVQYGISSIGPFKQYIDEGKLRPLALTGFKPYAGLPGVPVASATLPDFVSTIWTGLAAPVGTPAAAITKLNGAMQKALASPDVQAKIRQLGYEPNPSSPAEFAKLIKDEAAQWKGLADKGLLKP